MRTRKTALLTVAAASALAFGVPALPASANAPATALTVHVEYSAPSDETTAINETLVVYMFQHLLYDNDSSLSYGPQANDLYSTLSSPHTDMPDPAASTRRTQRVAENYFNGQKPNASVINRYVATDLYQHDPTLPNGSAAVLAAYTVGWFR